MALTNPYCSLTELKAALRLTDSIDDPLLEIAINSASREIDGYCERVFYSTTATRVYSPSNSTLCEIDDLVSLTTLKSSTNGDGVFDVTWTSSDYQLEPLNGIAGGVTTPYTRIRAVGDYLFPEFPYWAQNNEATVQVTGTFGYTSVPDAVKQACIILSMRQFKRFDSPLGVAGFGDIGVMRVSRVDPDVAALLDPYQRIRTA